MAGGFGAVPDDLFRAASAITDAVSGAHGMPWNGPSGDYGHAGVQDGWTGFVADLKSAVDSLAEKADGHSDNLKTNAMNYRETEDSSRDAIGKLGNMVESPAGNEQLGRNGEPD